MDLTTAPDFRPTARSSFPSGAFAEGENPAWRDTTARDYRLASGTPVIHARPDEGSVAARLVLVPSLRGHNPMFADLCVKLARYHAYEVISPELFPGRQHLDEAARIAACPTLDDDAILADIRAAAGLLGDGPVIVIGFCLGGMYAMKALADPGMAAAIAFYGFVKLPPDWQRPGREEPLDAIARGGRPVLGFYGAQDPLVPAADVAALGAAGATVKLYPEAGHAFAHDPSLPPYRADDAADAWRTAIDFIASLPKDG